MTAASVGQLSEDGLWSWEGKRWVHVKRVAIACGRCGNVVAVEQGKKEFKCPEKHQQDLVACRACRGTFQRPTSPVRCPLPTLRVLIPLCLDVCGMGLGRRSVWARTLAIRAGDRC